jgi:hypothetical protein
MIDTRKTLKKAKSERKYNRRHGGQQEEPWPEKNFFSNIFL